MGAAVEAPVAEGRRGHGLAAVHAAQVGELLVPHHELQVQARQPGPRAGLPKPLDGAARGVHAPESLDQFGHMARIHD